jgi:biotin operon repressor
MSRRPLSFNLSAADREMLEHISEDESSDSRIALRCKIILLTEDAVPLQEIADRLGLSKVTVNTCRQNYLRGGLDALKSKKRPGRPSKLAQEILSDHFHGSADKVISRLRQVLHVKAKSDHLLNVVNLTGGLITCGMYLSVV